MSQSTTIKPSANKDEYCFIRQVYLRGHLAPAFPPPTKQCTRCRKSFQSVRTMCLPCLRAISFEKECDAKDRKRDTFLDNCKTCEKTTLHLGPDWCTVCYAVPDHTFPVYCEECVVQNDVPNRVMDDKGGVRVRRIHGLESVHEGGIWKTEWSDGCEAEAGDG
ncbi:hypothetical protein FG05_35141 [Fusarium graminearum]|nr:hypothetical protein FG05_35141 [Fusarium graminearum]